MIDPHMLQGGASSWFWIAAYGAAMGVNLSGAAGFTGSAANRSSARRSSLLFTPAWNCASFERNLVASHRKM